MIESAWLLQCLPKTAAILDMTTIAADAGIEDVFQGMFSEE